MCVIAASAFGGHLCLVKNRDRNYVPKMKLVHMLHNGVEIMFLIDLTTGWLEGLNNHGISVVSSALMVKFDEKEGKKKGPSKSKNGRRILEALTKPTLRQACDSLLHYNRGILGHTFVANPHQIINIERTYEHDPVMDLLDTHKLHLRTNHGFHHPGAGYTEGEDYVSSRIRLEQARITLSQVDKPEDIAPALRRRWMSVNNPYNVVRKTDGMSTTSQLIMDLTDRKAYVYLFKDECEWHGYDNRLPFAYEPEITMYVGTV